MKKKTFTNQQKILVYKILQIPYKLPCFLIKPILWEVCGGNGCKYLLGNIKHYFLPQECTELEIIANFTCEGGCLDIYNNGKPHRLYW